MKFSTKPRWQLPTTP